jgi:hypothetical protein
MAFEKSKRTRINYMSKQLKVMISVAGLIIFIPALMGDVAQLLLTVIFLRLVKRSPTQTLKSILR